MLKKVLQAMVLLFFMAQVGGIFYAKVLLPAPASDQGRYRKVLGQEKAMLYAFTRMLPVMSGGGTGTEDRSRPELKAFAKEKGPKRRI